MRAHTHTHPCTTCQQPFTCTGDLVLNHDGWPETICTIYHEDGHTRCEACTCHEPPPPPDAPDHEAA